MNEHKILVAAALALFAELAVIRYEAAMVPLLAVFKNLSLISCFLGLGVGFYRAERSKKAGELFPFGLLLLVAVLRLMDLTDASLHFGNPIAEQEVMGLLGNEGIARIITFAFLLGLVVFNALLFIPLGQVTGAAMRDAPSPLLAYRWNLFGSLLGIGGFTLLTACWLGPAVWFAVICLLAYPLLFGEKQIRWSALIACGALIAISGYGPGPQSLTLYSPYQDVRLNNSPGRPPDVVTNGLYFQRILDLSPKSSSGNEELEGYKRYYDQPYKLATAKPDVLIVGSGTGNDVAAAVRNGAASVTAVEIDPVILALGKVLHPETPYSSPNVTAVLNDARNYIRHTARQFDVIVYGLLDSHSLLTGQTGGLRLDSYVYTVEALREARSRLKPGGFMSLSFGGLRNMLPKKFFYMIKEAFDGTEPIVLENAYDGAFTFLAGRPFTPAEISFLATQNNVTAEVRDRPGEISASRDNWPFLYMPTRSFPATYSMLIAGVLFVSYFFVRRQVGKNNLSISGQPFFLGAGFMLIETKAITELSLHLGAVYTVVALTIAAILLLALLGNELVLRGWHLSKRLCFTLLLTSIAVSYLATYVPRESISESVNLWGSTIILIAPIFFAGLCFSRQLEDDDLNRIFASNLLGAMTGAVIEYSSMYFGFRALYLVAAFLYLAAAFSPAPRGTLATAR